MKAIADTNYFVYIVECSDGTYYVGCTNDIEKRIRKHNHLKSGALYTKLRRPVALRYSETYPSLGDALRREHEIKKWERKRKEKLWLKNG